MQPFLCPAARLKATVSQSAQRFGVRDRLARLAVVPRMVPLVVSLVAAFGAGCSVWAKPLEFREAESAPGSPLDLRAGRSWEAPESGLRRRLTECDPCLELMFLPPGGERPSMVHAAVEPAAVVRPRDIEAGVIYEVPDFGREERTHFQVWIQPDLATSEDLNSLSDELAGGPVVIVRGDEVLGLASVPKNWRQGVLVAMFDRRGPAVALLEDLGVEHRVHRVGDEDRRLARERYEWWMRDLVRVCACESAEVKSAMHCDDFLAMLEQRSEELEIERPGLFAAVTQPVDCDAPPPHRPTSPAPSP